jgi:hypothetical protein
MLTTNKHRLIFFTVIFWLLGVPAAFGCVCEPPASVTEELNAARAVFAGKLVAAEYRKGLVDETRRMMEEMDGRRVEYEVLVLRFQVERWWKGEPVAEVLVRTNQTRDAEGATTVSDCDYPFKAGERYLVYAHGAENELSASACSRTATLQKAGKDLKTLGAGRAPEVAGRQPRRRG